MTMTVPDWLSKHGGTLGQGSDGRTRYVLVEGEPQYRLVTIPAGGKFSCQVTQTINGRRLDGGGVYPSAEEALRGGLEDLRKALGW
jgi:hypothetical protein